MTGKKSRLTGLFILLCGLLTGCAETVVEEENLILVEKETEALTYEMSVASISDVVKTNKVRCVYQQVNDEALCFEVSGKRVAEVFVELGDSVKKGQLIAKLDVGNAEEQIRTLEYNIARNELILSNLKLNEDNEISALWLKYLYQSSMSGWEEDALHANVERIQQSYQYTREDCEDAVALDKAQLQSLQKSLKESCVYAGMDGVVSYLKANLEGSTSVRDEEFIKIIDSSECLFAVEDISLADCFEEGVEVDMNIVSGSGAGDYKLVPHDMGNWGEQLLFAISGDTENINIEVGTTGTMKFVTDQREQVLTVPLEAVHEADGKWYVYVLGADNMREVKWIETGLLGDKLAEVVSGLTEGEKVIVR
ncbi:MAG: biotin/lipoyl-binding protein [Lachnospiraceae bacterium]|nr:biotin/lipoyl-binding protein [Lachnospiraceae bacterium]